MIYHHLQHFNWVSCDKPWVTAEFRQLIKRRQRAFLLGQHPLYKKLRNKSKRAASGGFRGGAGGAAAPPLASFRKIHGLPISKTVRKTDRTIIIITNFYLAASSHEIFLRVGGREGMKGLGALQGHQLPHPPCKNPGSATVNLSCFVETK